MLRLLYKHQKYEHVRIDIKGRTFNAILADTPIKRAIGLMFRASLKDNECMLIKFSREFYPGIWMHNMLFPLDIIWLDRKKRVVDLIRNAKPCKLLDCKTYTPRNRAQYVIEVKAGMAKKLGIKRNEKIDLEI